MKIIGYAYEADLHCVNCAVKRFSVTEPHKINMAMELDRNGISIDQPDNEGNPVHQFLARMNSLKRLIAETATKSLNNPLQTLRSNH